MDLLHMAAIPWISGLLLTVGFLGLLLEMQTLHGVAGTVGMAALALFFVAHIATGGVFVIVLAAVGLMLITYELHIVPGHMFPGALGIVALVLSMLLAFGPLGAAATFVALQTLATAIVATTILFYFAARAFPENAWVRRITFTGSQGADFVASANHSMLLGQSGTAVSFLRPAGVAQFGEKRIDVLTQGEFIPAGTPIRVSRVEGARIFVEPLGIPGFKE